MSEFEIIEAFEKSIPEDWNDAHVISGIYFLMDYSNDNPVYIGRSEDIFSRIHQHRVTKRPFDYFRYIEFPIDKLNEMELLMIKKFQPMQNFRGI